MTEFIIHFYFIFVIIIIDMYYFILRKMLIWGQIRNAKSFKYQNYVANNSTEVESHLLFQYCCSFMMTFVPDN